MQNKVIAVKDLIEFLEKSKQQLKVDSKNILTEEDRKNIMSEAMAKNDPKEKILAAHKSMNSVRLEGVLQGKTEVLDFLISLLKKKESESGT